MLPLAVANTFRIQLTIRTSTIFTLCDCSQVYPNVETGEQLNIPYIILQLYNEHYVAVWLTPSAYVYSTVIVRMSSLAPSSRSASGKPTMMSSSTCSMPAPSSRAASDVPAMMSSSTCSRLVLSLCAASGVPTTTSWLTCSSQTNSSEPLHSSWYFLEQNTLSYIYI